MPDASLPESVTLRRAFVDAYRPYVDGVLTDRGLAEPPGWDAAANAGREWLDDTLGALLATPLEAQRRSPLEVFQEALQAPTEALRSAGVAAPDRDAAEVQALPGDLYRLAPASSRDLGEIAWRAHLAWGVAKGRRVGGAVIREDAAEDTTPTPRRMVVALVGSDLMDRSKIEPVVRAAGLELEPWRNPAAIEEGLAGPLPTVVLVDLTHPAADAAIRSSAAAGVRTYAFGPHVDDVAMVRARSLGATDALARSRFFVRLPQLLPRLV